MKNIIFASFVACLLISTTSCKTKKQVVRNQQENRQGPNRQQSSEQRPDRQRRTPDQIMTQMDVNKDGRLSSAEAQGPLKNRFIAIDSNKDGFISLAELKAAPRPQRRPRGNAPHQNR